MIARRVLWYSRRYTMFFSKNRDVSEDALQEILLEILRHEGVLLEEVGRISRKSIANILSSLCLLLSGYKSMRSWLNRKLQLKIEYKETELEDSVSELKTIWSKYHYTDQYLLLVSDKFPLIAEYAESKMTFSQFASYKGISRYKFKKLISEAREYYVNLLWIESKLADK